MELNTFISRLFSAAEAAASPRRSACSQSDSFRVRVRRGELEDYQVSENAGLTLRGRVNGRIGHSQHAGAHRREHSPADSGRAGKRRAD